MPGLVTLPKPTEAEPLEEAHFVPFGNAYEHYISFAKQNFEFSVFKDAYLNRVKKLQEKAANQAKTADGGTNNNANEDDDEDDEVDDVDEEIYVTIPADYDFEIQVRLKSLDARNWRENDHYKVLGLNEFRYQTRPEDLKRAYRSLVLKYHPDKGRLTEEKVKQLKSDKIDLNSVFSCLTKSYEFLCKPSNRRSYDSYDPEFDDEVPNAFKPTKTQKTMDPEDFFELFTDVFARNSRWSKHLLPEFGDNQSTFDQVNDFYTAWYDFESWREFTYEKLEELDRAEDRWERRHYASEIKKENVQKRKEEVRRIRKLVDNAYKSDPRVKRFQKEELERKEAEKQKRKEEREAKKKEQERIEFEAKEKIRLEQEKKDAEAKAIRDAEKKEKEREKKLLKRARQGLKKKCTELLGEVESNSLDGEIALICSQLEAAQINALSDSLTSKQQVLDKHQEIKAKLTAETQKQQEATQKKKEAAQKEKDWSVDDIQILVKAANIFPAGTTKRWDKLAAYINDHTSEGSPNRSGKDCMVAVKKLHEKSNQGMGAKGSDDSFGEFLRLRKHANESKPQDGVISTTQDKKLAAAQKQQEIKAEPTANAAPSAGTETAVSKPWTAAEQKLFEQSLKTFPANFGKERWDRIAEAMPNRTKKECILRYKEIVAQVQAKKKAIAAANAKK